MAQGNQEIEVKLSREMSLLQVTMIGVGAMIGAGIFVLTGIAAGVAGPGLIVAFALNGLVAFLTAMAYAELGSAFPEAGGGYLWAKEGLPGPNGFLAGWISWFAHAVACSLYSLGFGAYLGETLAYAGFHPSWLGGEAFVKVVAVIVVAVFAYINFRGASETGRAGAIVAIGKVLILGLFVAVGLFVIFRKPNWQASFTPFFPTGASGVLMAMGLTYIAFEGYEVIAQSGEEVENPKRMIPRAIFFSLLIVIPIYILVAFVSIGVVTPPEGMRPWEFLAERKELGVVEAARYLFRGGGLLILFGGLLSTLSALNATIYSSSRVAFAMGRDRSLPHFLSRIHTRRKTPHYAILFSAFIIVGMALLLPIEDVASAADLMFLFLFIQVNFALIRLRQKRPELDRGFRVPLLPWVPYLAVGAQLLIALFMIRLSPKAWISASLWIGAGVGLYYLYARHRMAGPVYRGRVIEPGRRAFRVLVPLANPAHVEALMTLAGHIAAARDGEVIALYVAEVPPDLPLHVDEGMIERGRALFRPAVEVARRLKVPLRSRITVTHRLSYGILSTAREEEASLILMGRAKTRDLWDRVFNTLIDLVLAQAPCGVVILRPDGLEMDRILFLPQEPRSARLAARLIGVLAPRLNARVHALEVLPPEALPEEVQQAEARLRSLLEEVPEGVPARFEILRHPDPADALLRKVRPQDLIVVGMGREGPLERLFLGSLSDQILEGTTCPVLLVKERELAGRRGWFGRLIGATAEVEQ